VIHASPGGGTPPRPSDDPDTMPSRNAAAQRRAMQAAISNAVRALRSTGGRRSPGGPSGRDRPGGI
jgi:hypothetical protein